LPTEVTLPTLNCLSAAVRRAAIERALKAGQYLFRAGDRTAGLYEVVDGKVRLVRVDRSGREAILQAAETGDTLAEASLFSPIYHCDAIATTAAVVRLYPRPTLLNELKRNPKAAQAFLEMLARQVMTLRKGAVSIYRMGRFPVTLYKEQWLKLLDMSADIRAFIAANEAQLKKKD
jgi:CRP-like cAMP-binding protein